MPHAQRAFDLDLYIYIYRSLPINEKNIESSFSDEICETCIFSLTSVTWQGVMPNMDDERWYDDHVTIASDIED